MAVGESRSELLQWLNATLELNYRKIEECGSGAAFCQLIDCIMGGVPMSKVKFGVSSEYDYRQNWKILQAQFTKHNITKVIDVEKLMKCRLQDNLELLQWFKRLWAESRGYHEYDAREKRKSNGGNTSANTSVGTITPQKRNSGRGSTIGGRRVSSGGYGAPGGVHGGTVVVNQQVQKHGASVQSHGANPNEYSGRSVSGNGVSANNTTSVHGNSNNVHSAHLNTSNSHASSSTLLSGNNKLTLLNKELADAHNDLYQLSEEVQEYKIQTETLETERNFYFNKLREIEILIQNINELVERNDFAQLKELTVMDLSKKIQTILYMTEEGFQAGDPAEHEHVNRGNSEHVDRRSQQSEDRRSYSTEDRRSQHMEDHSMDRHQIQDDKMQQNFLDDESF